MKEHLGVTVMLAPQSLMQTWTSEAAQCYKQEQTDKPLSSLDCVLVKAHLVDISNKDKAGMRGKITEKPPEEDGKPVRPDLAPRLENSRYLVLTTSQSLKTRFLRKLSETKKYMVQPEGQWRTNKKGDRYKTVPNPIQREIPDYAVAVVAILGKDEFHLEKNATSAAMNAIKDLNIWQRKQLVIWLIAMSGTPLLGGPSDMASWLKAMSKDSWIKHKVLRKWMADEMTVLGQEWDINCRNRSFEPKHTTAIVKKMQPIYEHMMLRFTTTSEFLDAGPVVVVPKSIYVPVYVSNPEWDDCLSIGEKEETARVRSVEDVKGESVSSHTRPLNYYLKYILSPTHLYILPRLYGLGGQVTRTAKVVTIGVIDEAESPR
jgi:hypothetical protein